MWRSGPLLSALALSLGPAVAWRGEVGHNDREEGDGIIILVERPGRYLQLLRGVEVHANEGDAVSAAPDRDPAEGAVPGVQGRVARRGSRLEDLGPLVVVGDGHVRQLVGHRVVEARKHGRGGLRVRGLDEVLRVLGDAVVVHPPCG